MTPRKNNHGRILALSLLLPFLCLSCSNGQKGFYEFGELSDSPFERVDYDGYHKVGEYDDYESNGHTIDMDFSPIYQSGNIVFNMPSTGEVPLLVVPVDFSDSVGNKEGIGRIQCAFNGNREVNQFVSVSEFFARSSLDRLHLKPYVLNNYFRSTTYSKVTDLSAIHSDSRATSALSTIYNECRLWLASAHSEIDLTSFSFTSVNGREVLPIYFVYNAPYAGEYDDSTTRSSMLWAFTVSRPAPISWSSIDMLHPSGDKVDAHTFIHETGHLFGLDDYYDTNSTETVSKLSPLGRMDMMDCSLGDHNAFSKLLLGWERPYVPTSDCEITLHQASGNNESILYSPSWNGTLFDSYLLLEFYTPTGLNYTDAYERNDPAMKLFEKPGVKIYKVEADLELYNGSYPTGTYLNHENYEGGRLGIGHSNSDASAPLIRLLNKYQNNDELTPYFIASDHEEDLRRKKGDTTELIHLSEALFYEGDGIDEEHFSSLYEEFGVKIRVSSLNSSYAKITFDF